MGKMNELDLCIQEVVQDNETLRAQVVEEIDMHLSGLTPFGELSFEAQRAIELFETQNADDIHYNEQFGYPGSDEDYLDEGEVL